MSKNQIPPTPDASGEKVLIPKDDSPPEAVIVPEKDIKYETVLERFAKVQSLIDNANMERYHKIGEIFNDFCDGIERNSYGDNTVQKLADDLQVRGVLSDIVNPVRYLYWARGIYAFDPSYKKLAELSKRGFTVTHAKMIFSLDEKIRGKMLLAFLSSDQVPSTRELEPQIRLLNVSSAAQEVHALATDPTPAAPVAAPDVAPAAASVPAAAPASTGMVDAPAPTDKPDAASKVGKVEREDDTPVSPLKSLNMLEKLVSKVVIGIPDAFIAIRTAEKKGFDSDKAQKNYATLLSNLRSAVSATVEPLAELQKLLDEVKTD